MVSAPTAASLCCGVIASERPLTSKGGYWSRVGGQTGTEQDGPKILKFTDFDSLRIDACREETNFDIGNGKPQREERMLGPERMHVLQP